MAAVVKVLMWLCANDDIWHYTFYVWSIWRQNDLYYCVLSSILQQTDLECNGFNGP